MQPTGKKNKPQKMVVCALSDLCNPLYLFFKPRSGTFR